MLIWDQGSDYLRYVNVAGHYLDFGVYGGNYGWSDCPVDFTIDLTEKNILLSSVFQTIHGSATSVSSQRDTVIFRPITLDYFRLNGQLRPVGGRVVELHGFCPPGWVWKLDHSRSVDWPYKMFVWASADANWHVQYNVDAC